MRDCVMVISARLARGARAARVTRSVAPLRRCPSPLMLHRVVRGADNAFESPTGEARSCPSQHLAMHAADALALNAQRAQIQHAALYERSAIVDRHDDAGLFWDRSPKRASQTTINACAAVRPFKSKAAPVAAHCDRCDRNLAEPRVHGFARCRSLQAGAALIKRRCP